jgi:radical SAM superfamily enzyme YgiQ (UPF0313 family)
MNVFYDQDRAFKILEILREKGKEVGVNLDITIKDFNEQLVLKTKEYGIDFFIGLESFNLETRKKIGKPFSDEELEAVFEIAEKNKIDLTGNVLLGLPWQTLEEINNDIKKILYYTDRYKYVFLKMSIFKPEYGTDIQKDYFDHLHSHLNFKDIVEIYLNKVAKYQDIVYGEKFKSIDFEKLFYLLLHLMNIKRVLNKDIPKLSRRILVFFKEYLERHLMSQTYKSNIITKLLLRNDYSSFINMFIFPVLSFNLSTLNSEKIKLIFTLYYKYFRTRLNRILLKFKYSD